MKDVVVIGAGPAGIHAAFLLAQAGLDVALFEAQSRVGEKAICSGVVGDEAFARFDLPTQPILSDIRCIQAISPGGRKLEHRTDAPLAQVIDKAEFNRALRRSRYCRRSGIEARLLGEFSGGREAFGGSPIPHFGAGINEPPGTVGHHHHRR